MVVGAAVVLAVVVIASMESEQMVKYGSIVISLHGDYIVVKSISASLPISLVKNSISLRENR